MVLSTLITTIINSFLSPFVDELTAEQLNIFTWSGQVSLTNVSIKPNAFDQLKLPFRIVHGHIGRIYASVPWRNIYAEPIVIKVSDVYAVALPNSGERGRWQNLYFSTENILTLFIYLILS